MHDNPAIWPLLPSRKVTAEDKRLMLDPVEGTVWQTCWEFKLSHTLTDAEGAAFWTGANLAMDAARLAAIRERLPAPPMQEPEESA